MNGEEALTFLELECIGLFTHMNNLRNQIKQHQKEFKKSNNKKINLLSEIDDLEDEITETELMIKNNEIMYLDLKLAMSQGHKIQIEFGPWENN